MKILIAPDKFKGSLTAMQVCETIKSALDERRGHYITCIPLADGGEGTCDLLTRISNGKFVSTKVFDPLLREIESGYGISGDNSIAFIEMAQASGLQLLKPEERNCSIATSFGTGQLIKHALEQGVKEIILGIGGSATNDAGTGMAQALGFKFLTTRNEELNGIGANLTHIDKINCSEIHPQLKETRFTILCDVDNPLYGPMGAAHVFAKQKGASNNDIEILDNGLKNFAKLAIAMNCNTKFPGAGAAGGLGAGSKLFLNANIQKGINFIIKYSGLEEKIMEADLIITGEGRLDEQTLSGKVVMGVAQLVKKYNKKLVLVAGASTLTPDKIRGLKIFRLLTLQDENITMSASMKNAESILRKKIGEYFFL